MPTSAGLYSIQYLRTYSQMYASYITGTNPPGLHLLYLLQHLQQDTKALEGVQHRATIIQEILTDQKNLNPSFMVPCRCTSSYIVWTK